MNVATGSMDGDDPLDRKLRNYEYTVVTLQDVLKMDPEHIEARKQLYELHLAYGKKNPSAQKRPYKYEAVLEMEMQYLAINPQSIPTLSRVAELCDLLGYKNSAAFYRECIEKINRDET